VGRLVWEAKPIPSGPPECIPKSEDGVGLWRCTIMYARGKAEGFAPSVPPGVPAPPQGVLRKGEDPLKTAVVTVHANGALTGRDGSGHPVKTCCVKVR
jgi:hypothetical protein